MVSRPVRDRSGSVARLALLGVLARGPAHGYQIKATLARWDMHWWADIQSGSIYSGLRRLEDDGFVKVAESGRNGQRPAHRVFEITDEGRAQFRSMLRDAWVDTTRFSRPVDLAVSFFDELPRAEIVPLLTERVDRLKLIESAFLTEPELPNAGPAQRAVVQDLRDHERRLLRAEIDWTEQLISRMRRKAYPASYGRSK
jgi:DNA-binding PadR family transcriptional regulator